VRTICEQGEEVIQMWTPHFLAQKNSNFSKFMVCPHGQGRERELSQCGHFADKESQFFAVLTDLYSFYDGHMKKETSQA